MKSKIFMILIGCSCTIVKAQKKWDKDLVVKYKMTDKADKLINYIEVKKDTIYYQWIEKERPVNKKIVMNDTLAEKIVKAMNGNKVLKFKSAALTNNSTNVIFTYIKGGKARQIIFQQPIKQNSMEEKFIKEFMEPITRKVFEEELKLMLNK